MAKLLLRFLFIFICLSSCVKKPSDPLAPPEEKDVSELTSQDIFKIALVSQNASGTAYTGQVTGNDARDEISIYADGNCGSDDCGIKLLMENKNSRKEIQAAIKLKFKLPENENSEITRLYTLKPKEAISIGCSHICHRKSSYMIQREIVMAAFVTPSETIN